eukprot:145607-Rhodomonas_salina.1
MSEASAAERGISSPPAHLWRSRSTSPRARCCRRTRTCRPQSTRTRSPPPAAPQTAQGRLCIAHGLCTAGSLGWSGRRRRSRPRPSPRS